MDTLVLMDGKKAYTTSRIIAGGCGLDHDSVIWLIKKYSEKINDVGFTEYKSGKFKTAGRPGIEYLLDEPQTTFLISLMKNSEIVVEFKKLLVQGFFKQRNIIAQLISRQSDANWQNIRKDGKQIYFQKTDVIKKFVEYAKEQGSKSSFGYYANFAKMENSALFFFEQKYKNMREVMTIRQLMQVATADDVIEKAIKEGMEEKLFYKDIYKKAKKRIIAFAEIIGKSPILSLEMKGE